MMSAREVVRNPADYSANIVREAAGQQLGSHSLLAMLDVFAEFETNLWRESQQAARTRRVHRRRPRALADQTGRANLVSCCNLPPHPSRALRELHPADLVILHDRSEFYMVWNIRPIRRSGRAQGRYSHAP